MASVSNATITIVRNVANANVTVTYDVNWSQFDQLTNLQYTESVRLIGDDTGQDGDDGVVGDDSIFTGIVFVPFPPVISSNGLALTPRTKSFVFAFANLNEDSTLPFPDNDDEIRAVITLTPRLPVTVTAESNLVTVNA